MGPELTYKHMICFILFSIQLIVTQGNFYTSVFKLSLLISEEKRLIKALSRYLSEKKHGNITVSHELYRILQTSEEEQKFIGTKTDYPQNPINAFHFLYRIQKDWPKAHSYIVCESCELDSSATDFDLTYHAVQNQFLGLPSKIDIQGAADSVLRLWNVYQFNLKEFFEGIISDSRTKPLSAEEILYIARRAETNDDLYEAFHWLKELYRRFKNGEYSSSDVSIGTVAKALAGVYDKNGLPWKSLEVLEDFKSDPKFSRHFEYYKTRADTKRRDVKSPTFKRIFLSPAGRKHHLTYESLCRGEIKSAKALSYLYCYWRRSAIPYLLVKEEVVSHDPKISLYHDVIYDDEIWYIKNISAQKMDRSHMVSADGQILDGEKTGGRVSQTAWLSDLQFPELRKLAKRIEILTGMATEHKIKHCESEEFQVLNYGVGGMYEPHQDPLGYRIWEEPMPADQDQCKGSGDRIATWMFYLSDVKIGGATVFPLIKARVRAEKGAAAFWYNFKRNGDQDYNTQHAGCPVLLGSKWVSNKWLREEGQMLRRRCGLNVDDIDTMNSNDLRVQWLS